MTRDSSLDSVVRLSGRDLLFLCGLIVGAVIAWQDLKSDIKTFHDAGRRRDAEITELRRDLREVIRQR